MNAKRAKFTADIKEEVVPLLIHDPHAVHGEPAQYYATFATADEAEAAVASLAHQQQQQLHHHLHDDETTEEIIIDEHGRAVTIQQLVSDEGNTVEEVEAVEESDGQMVLHIMPSEHEQSGSADDDGEEGDPERLSPSEAAALGLRSKTFYCPNCGNCYSAAGSLKLHMRACMRQREEVPAAERRCEICQKVFNSVNYLKEHVLRHTGEGPRRCTRCYRKFVDEEKYNAHMEAHKQQDKLDAEAEALAASHGGRKVVVKEFTCSFCSENFQVVFDVGQVKRRYACDACREKYSNAEMLKQHKQMVDDKREFPCERCGRKFVFEGFLQRHLPTCDGTIKRRRDMK